MAAYAVGKILEVPEEKIIFALGKLNPLTGRLNIQKGPKGSLLLNDALRANPASTIAGLITLSDLPGKRKIAILGEMGELGEFSEKGHRQVGEKIAGLKIDYLVAVGPLTKFIVDSASKRGFSSKKIFWTKDVKEAAEVLNKILKKNDMLYLKGSLLRHMERILLILEGKIVKCREISCHFYLSCEKCPNLK
jgi:UDP-N-acetylmuramyl pentapeptide synthase